METMEGITEDATSDTSRLWPSVLPSDVAEVVCSVALLLLVSDVSPVDAETCVLPPAAILIPTMVPPAIPPNSTALKAMAPARLANFFRLS